jgi:hypothetical protein
MSDQTRREQGETIMGAEQWSQMGEISSRLMRDPNFLATVEAAIRGSATPRSGDADGPDVRVEGGGGGSSESYGWSRGSPGEFVGPLAAVAAVAVAVVAVAVGPGTFGPGGTGTGTGTEGGTGGGTGDGGTGDGGTDDGGLRR